MLHTININNEERSGFSIRNNVINDLDVYSSTLVEAAFNNCTINDVYFDSLLIRASTFENTWFISGNFSHSTTFSRCEFKKCRFNNLIISKTTFSNCRFIGCDFNYCIFRDIRTFYNDKPVEFIKCAFSNTTFRRCEFKHQEEKTGTIVLVNGITIPSCYMKDSVGYIFLVDTSNIKGLSTQGFKGSITYTENKGAETNKTTTQQNLSYIAEEEAYWEDFYNKNIKKSADTKHPVRFISVGL